MPISGKLEIGGGRGGVSLMLTPTRRFAP